MKFDNKVIFLAILIINLLYLECKVDRRMHGRKTYQSKSTLNQVHKSAKLYLSNEDINQKVENLLSNCNANLKRTSIKEFLKHKSNSESILIDLLEDSDNVEEYHKYLYFLDLSLDDGKKKKKVFLSAGEHPRELIPVDTLTTYLENLCSNDKKGDVLDKFDFRIVLTANPISRNRVLNGEYCLRANPNKVDINRNWDIKFGQNIEYQEEYCGDQAFNQVETTFLRESISDFEPFVFITLHSGTMAMFHPHSYSTEPDYVKTKWGSITKKHLNTLKSNLCKNCDVGLPSQYLGYVSTGSSIDYVYEVLKVPIAMTWEIYDIEKFPELKDFMKRSKSSFIQRREIKKKKDINYNLELTTKYEGKDFDKLIKDIDSESELIECFELFNPLTQISYDFTIQFWNKILDNYFIGLSKEIKKNKKRLK